MRRVMRCCSFDGSTSYRMSHGWVEGTDWCDEGNETALQDKALESPS
jgi:hypothetical protein